MNDYIKDAWKYYEYGRAYNNNLVPNQYTMVNTNTEFFNGNQWIHMPDTPAMRRLAKPTFNIIKRVTSLFVASLTSSNTTISFEPLSYRTDGEAAAFATAEVRNLLEKFKMDYRIRDALFDGAITGDYAAHFFWNPEARPYGGAFGEYKGEIEMELLDGINVMFGNPNCRDVEKQPYILIVGRDTVENLKREALYWRNQNKHSPGGEDHDARPDVRRSQLAGPPHAAVDEVSFRGEAPDFARKGTAAYAPGASSELSDKEPFLPPLPKGGRATKWRGDSSRRSGDISEADRDINITPDTDLHNFPTLGGKTELHGDDEKTGKALYVYLYTKVWKTEQYINPKTGLVELRKVQTVHVTKATRHCNIFEDVDTGLSRYPIAWGNWQKQRNQYHGRALVTEIIPNQIFINQMMAMVFRHLQTQAFPTKIYNADLIPNISNEVGTAIGVRNLQPGQQVGEVISTIPAANMSAQIIQAIDLCMAYTRECLGATDAQMGSVKPDNTSALMVLQNASEVPLENTRAGLHEWVEDIGAILLDMMGTYYGMRPIVKDNILQEFDFSVFKHLWLNVSVDVGATTYYSEIAMVQTLDNLRRDGTLSIIEYLERMPDKLITRKQELIDSMKKRMGENIRDEEGLPIIKKNTVYNPPLAGRGDRRNATVGEVAFSGATGVNDLPVAGQSRGVTESQREGETVKLGSVGGEEGAYVIGGELDAAKKIAQLPTSMQARYNDLPKTAQRALIK